MNEGGRRALAVAHRVRPSSWQPLVTRSLPCAPLASSAPAAQNGTMNAVTYVFVVRYADGRIFPAVKPLPPEVTEHLRSLEHGLHCGEGLSYRKVQRAMMARHGARRSLGQVFNDLRDFQCSKCAPQKAVTAGHSLPPAPTPNPVQPQRPRVRAEVFEWR